MKAKGNTKIILGKVGEIQSLVGQAKGGYVNDLNPNRARDVIEALDKAFELCIEITGMYDPT